jgi:hypothetical protein
VLAEKNARIVEERSARKEPLDDAEARSLLGRARKVIVASRGRSRVLEAASATLEELKGPTGNYRAPILLVGDTLVVGYDRAALDELL